MSDVKSEFNLRKLKAIEERFSLKPFLELQVIKLLRFVRFYAEDWNFGRVLNHWHKVDD